MFNTPILFIVFRRLSPVKRVFEQIKKRKPKRFYIASDGPRNDAEKIAVQEVRDYLRSNVDWDCEIHEKFRETNAGCKLNVAEAISWFFEREEGGIILEEDCLPNQDFFRFCETMLQVYRDDKRIMYIAGTCPIREPINMSASYHYSYIGDFWGWATWKRTWEKYEMNMDSYSFLKAEGVFKHVIPSWLARLRLHLTLRQIRAGYIDTWDYQFGLSCFANSGLVIVPNHNLISNIGFTGSGTNTFGKSKWSNLPRKKISDPILHPQYVVPKIKMYKKHLRERELNIIYNFITDRRKIKRLCNSLFSFRPKNTQKSKTTT